MRLQSITSQSRLALHRSQKKLRRFPKRGQPLQAIWYFIEDMKM